MKIGAYWNFDKKFCMNNPILKTTILLSFFVLSSTLFATPQVPDIIYINGEKYPLHTELFFQEIGTELWLDLHDEISRRGKKGNLSLPGSPTALRRGFRCSWKIEGSKLYLVELEALARKFGIDDLRGLYRINTDDLSVPKFDSSSGRYFFTGTLWAALGDPCAHVRVSCFGDEYKKMMRINLKEGAVTSIDYFYHIEYCDGLVIPLGSFASDELFDTNIGFYRSWTDYTIDSVKTSCDGIKAVFPSSKFGSDITLNMQIKIIPHTLKGQFQHTIYLEITVRTGKKQSSKIIITGEAL